jgi:hypothetical protein
MRSLSLENIFADIKQRIIAAVKILMNQNNYQIEGIEEDLAGSRAFYLF